MLTNTNFLTTEVENNQIVKSNFTDTISLSLTEREIEIINLIVEGLSTKEIAKELFVSFNTIKTHRMRIRYKLNVKNVAGVVREAFLGKIISFARFKQAC